MENAMAAAALCLVMGIKADIIAKVLKTFPGVEHRLEPVRTLNGVLYVKTPKALTLTRRRRLWRRTTDHWF